MTWLGDFLVAIKEIVLQSRLLLSVPTLALVLASGSVVTFPS